MHFKIIWGVGGAEPLPTHMLYAFGSASILPLTLFLFFLYFTFICNMTIIILSCQFLQVKHYLLTGAKNVLLWKFLLEELSKPNGNNVQWVDEREGLFRFVDTTEVSKLWGLKKNKDDMNFGKLSRGIR